jgi:hypothetical protein
MSRLPRLTKLWLCFKNVKGKVFSGFEAVKQFLKAVLTRRAGELAT